MVHLNKFKSSYIIWKKIDCIMQRFLVGGKSVQSDRLMGGGGVLRYKVFENRMFRTIIVLVELLTQRCDQFSATKKLSQFFGCWVDRL